MAAAAAADSPLEAPNPAGESGSSAASPEPEPPPAAGAGATASEPEEPPNTAWSHGPAAVPAATAIANRYRVYRARRRLLRICLPSARPRYAWLRPTVAAALRPHQWIGVRWLATHALPRGGGILADDPGIGKTLQALAVLEAMVRSGLATRVLIVAPSNNCRMWESELRRWCGGEPGEAPLRAVSLMGDGGHGLSVGERLRSLARTPPPPGHATGGPPPRHTIGVISFETIGERGQVPMCCSIPPA